VVFSKMKRKSILIVLTILILILSFTFIYIYQGLKQMDTHLPRNIWLDDTPLGGKNLSEANDIMDQLIEKQLNKKVLLIFSQQNSREIIEFSLLELGFESNKELIKEQIHSLRMPGAKLLPRLKNYLSLQYKGLRLTLQYDINKEVLRRTLSSFDDSRLQKPKNAEYIYKDRNLSIVDEVIGYEFDLEKLCEDLKKSNFPLIHVEVKEAIPKITSKSLKEQGINEKVASFSTKFSTSNVPRSHNIKLASSIISGTVLSPGEIFSFNNTVGERTKERGYKEAGVYLNGEVAEGLGGGICQVSTTLYNAVLLADLEIVERSNHSLTVPYVPLSRDASVSWNHPDLKFKNNTNHSIYIGTETKGNTITFDLFGTKNNKEVELISTVLSKKSPPILYKEDASLQPDTEIVVENGHVGYVSTLIKNIYIDGELISSEVVSKDKYLTSPKIIKRNKINQE